MSCGGALGKREGLDWSSAIHNLKSMTEAGLYPKSKRLNTWSETATKRERRRKKPTWIKQREHILIKSRCIVAVVVAVVVVVICRTMQVQMRAMSNSQLESWHSSEKYESILVIV